MKNLITISIAALLAACSGSQEDFESLELGQTDQAYTAKVTNNYQFGTQTAAAHRQCNRTSSAQVCSVPKTKTFTYCINSGFTNSEIATISATVQEFDSILSTWSFTYESDLFTGQCLLTNTLQFSKGACGQSGTSSGKIENYGCVSYSGTTNLTEGAIGDDPVGNYQAHGFANAKIDITDIDAKFSTASARTNAKKHAVGFAMLSSIGLGSRNDGASNTFYSRSDIADFPLGILTAGEDCRAESFSTANKVDYSNQLGSGLCNTVD